MPAWLMLCSIASKLCSWLDNAKIECCYWYNLCCSFEVCKYYLYHDWEFDKVISTFDDIEPDNYMKFLIKDIIYIRKIILEAKQINYNIFDMILYNARSVFDD